MRTLPTICAQRCSVSFVASQSSIGSGGSWDRITAVMPEVWSAAPEPRSTPEWLRRRDGGHARSALPRETAHQDAADHCDPRESNDLRKECVCTIRRPEAVARPGCSTEQDD